jgi:cytochrome c-type biogenesis protein CcmH/NrfF
VRTARTLARTLIAAATILAVATPARAAGPVSGHASLPGIEREVMCVTCKIPLELAQSPQADRERAFISALLRRGDSEAQIKRALVAQYGSSVLALPSAHGFDAVVYVVPIAALVAVLALLAVLLPRWRRAGAGAREGANPGAVPDVARAITPEDSERLSADMSRFD